MTAKEDLRHQRISVILHSAVALALGLLSPYAGRPLYAFGLVVMAGVITGHVTQRIVGKKKFSWWLGNGLFIYLLVWADVWIFIANYF
jgi:apolipoprotein N-acyltransferase